MKKKALLLLLALILIMTSIAFGHSGRTDSSGGHKDNNNKSGLGSYHYHHGYGPHLHSNGICLYSSSSTSTSSSTSNSTLSKSSKTTISYSSTVNTYQFKLNKLGFSCGEVDGYLGSKTKKAIEAFQENQSLAVNGLLNSDTKTLIDTKYTALLKIISKQATNATGLTKNQLIQTKLKDLGYYTGDIDGSLGLQSIKAIKVFQKSKGILADGIVGPITLSYLGLE